MNTEKANNTVDVVVRGAQNPKPIDQLIGSALKRAGSQSDTTDDTAVPQIEIGNPVSGTRPRYPQKETR